MYDFVIKFIADYLVIIIVIVGGLVVLFMTPKVGRYQRFVRVLMMGLTALLLARLITLVFHPDELRPFAVEGKSALAAYLNNPGFPSDHMLFVTTITLAVWVATKHVGMTIALLVGSLIVGVGRVLALVHTPLDVIGGLVIAIVAALIWYPKALFHKSLN